MDRGPALLAFLRTVPATDQLLSDEEMEYLFPNMTFTPELPTPVVHTRARRSREHFAMSRRPAPSKDTDISSFLKRHSWSRVQLYRATISLVDLYPGVLRNFGPGTRRYFVLLKAICFLSDMFPFQRKMIDSVTIAGAEEVFKALWTVAQLHSIRKFREWVDREVSSDEPKQMTVKVSEQHKTIPFLIYAPKSIGFWRVAADGFGKTCLPYQALVDFTPYRLSHLRLTSPHIPSRSLVPEQEGFSFF